MTDVQGKLLELLTDIKDICTREKIKFYLCAETAYGAVKNHAFLSGSCHAHVAMTTADVLKFVAAVKKENRPDRILDSMLNNATYTDFTVRYGDPNTMLVRLPYKPGGEVPCIAVTIHMIRYKPVLQKKYFRYTRALWRASQKDAKAYTNALKRIAVVGCRIVKGLVGPEKLGRHFFKKWCALFSANKKSAKVSICDGKFIYKREIIMREDTVMLEGVEFPVFGYVDDYLNQTYGCANFRKITPKYAKESATLLASSHISYKKYFEQAKAMGIDFDAVRRNMKHYEKYRAIVAADNKVIDKYYALVDRTQKRYAMYEKYMPMKKLLIQLYEEERFKELNLLLKPYRSALWSCYKKGLGLCFDKKIFEMTTHILRMEGSYCYANKLYDLVPEEHWKPMVVTDYKGDLTPITDVSELLAKTMAEEPIS